MPQSLLAALGGSKLLTLAFWRDVLARAGRQAQQSLLPVFAAAALTGGLQGIDVRAAAVYLGGAELVVLVRALYELRLQNDVVDRVAAAFAGSLLGVVAAVGFNLLHTDWRTNLGVAGAAAVTSLLQFAFDKLGPVTTAGVDTSATTSPVTSADPAGDEDLTPVDTVDFGGVEGDVTG